MAIFVFYCNDCGKSFELLIANYKSIIQCEYCKSNNVKRNYSKEKPSFKLNGGGWSKDNYQKSETVSTLDK
jgi:putative FmdB family regulatory protein